LLKPDGPPLAHIEGIESHTIPVCHQVGFTILESSRMQDGIGHVPPDTALCEDCLRELFDPSDRRYHYPFITCTHCGPRFTLIDSLPYDRPRTSMANFHLCPACEREYHDPKNRRFHAQPVACPACGPQIWFENTAGEVLSERENALQSAVGLVRGGGILGLKGLGGFHLACDATNPRAVALLRERKSRPDKPLAVMARDLASVAQVAELSPASAQRLSQPDHPILLLPRHSDSPLMAGIAPGLNEVGVMLPYTPLHHLLMERMPLLVMTSGNPSGVPISIDNQQARDALSSLVDGFLMHDRPILQPCDDSVIRWDETAPVLIRRARGIAPQAIMLPAPVTPTLAVGGDLKNAFCLASGREAFLSQHIGDLESLEAEQLLERSVAHFIKFTGITPRRVVCDLHPGYQGTHWAERYARQHGLPLSRVQHHQAHAAGLLADNNLSGDEPAIIFAFDGTGYGIDDTVWGGEIFLARNAEFERIGHLIPQPLPGGDAAVRNPSRIALAWLVRAGIAWDASLPPVMATTPMAQAVLKRQVDSGFASSETSSIGRLFDAVGGLCGVRQSITFEGQAAMMLEALADHEATGSYAFDHIPDDRNQRCMFDPAPLLNEIVADLKSGVGTGIISMRFHRALGDLIHRAALTMRARTGIIRVGLTGGVFQNALLVNLTRELLDTDGFMVMTHRQIPANDGGLSYGQVWLDHLLNQPNVQQE
jgi:hydrogenase maturation protein HypF